MRKTIHELALNRISTKSYLGLFGAKFCENVFISFCAILPTNQPTERQTDKVE